MAHCLEHTKDKAFLVYFLCGIKLKFRPIKGTLQFPVKSFLITISWLMLQGNVVGFGFGVTANGVPVVSEQEGTSATSC